MTYAESHPKSYISVLIVQGMVNDPSADVKKTETIFNGLDESLKKYESWKIRKKKLTEINSCCWCYCCPS
jgi:hypothetical protein